MPATKTDTVTHSDALEAIRVVATLATSISTNRSEPFTYADVTNAANREYAMTPANSLPGLVVWLLLVTNPDFINDIATGSSNFPKSDIAKSLNLTEAGVDYILKPLVNRDVATLQLFNKVANLFQTLTFYRPPNCPRTYADVLRLAGPAAAIDPSAG